MTAPVAINARAAIRAQGGGVERVARELVRRLPELTPDRYRVVAPPSKLAHKAGHSWEQLVLPVHSRRSKLLFSPANTFPLTGSRNAVFVHDLAPLEEPQWYGRAYGAWHRTLLRALPRRAELAIAPSELVRHQLIDRLGMAPERTAAAPLGVDPAFHGDVDPEPLRARLGLDRPYVLAVGTAVARKNLGLLERAAPTLAAEGLETVIAGGTRAYMRSEQTKAAARHLGYVAPADLPALYAGAAVLAFPSLYEGFGLPCVEAMACGTPVVATDRGALAETCGDAALYIEPDDPDALARSCLLAAFDGDTRDRLVQSGHARAAGYRWEETARRVDAAIASALAR